MPYSVQPTGDTSEAPIAPPRPNSLLSEYPTQYNLQESHLKCLLLLHGPIRYLHKYVFTLDPLKVTMFIAHHPLVIVTIIVIAIVIVTVHCPGLFLRDPHHEEEISPGLRRRPS